MKIEIEGIPDGINAAPYWVIIDPRQNFNTDDKGIYNIGSMITGIWFSYKEAKDYLKSKHYNFSKNAKVFCFSGHYNNKYLNEWRKK